MRLQAGNNLSTKEAFKPTTLNIYLSYFGGQTLTSNLNTVNEAHLFHGVNMQFISHACLVGQLCRMSNLE